MHEGDHGILDHGYDREPGLPVAERRSGASRAIAAAIVGASVVLFLVWRFL